MTPSADLFELIHSLSKNEKRYFRLFASMQEGEKHYLKLFEAVSAQKRYDETMLIAKLKGGHFPSRFSMVKGYLYGLIIKSLRLYYDDLSVNTELRGMISAAEILFHKGLYHHGRKQIIRAKQYAISNEKFIAGIEACFWEGKAMNTMGIMKFSEKDFENVYQQGLEFSTQQRTESEYEVCMNKLLVLTTRGGFVREADRLAAMEKIMRAPILQDIKTATSLQSKIMFCVMHSFYNYFKGDLKVSYRYDVQLKELFENHPRLIRELPGQYINTLFNHIVNCVHMGHFDEADAVVQEMKIVATPAFFGQNALTLGKAIVLSVRAELELCVRTAQIKRGIALVPLIESALVKYHQVINEYVFITTYYNIAHIYFMKGNYAVSREWLNKALNNTAILSKQDLYCMARILNLILLYELGNYELLDYALKSTHKMLSRSERLFRTEHVVLNFMKKVIAGTQKRTELVKLFLQMKKEFASIQRDPLEKNFSEYFDCISWVESKIEGRTFEEVVREKSKKQ